MKRRTFVTGALAACSVLAAGAGYRMIHDTAGRDLDVIRKEQLLASIRPGTRAEALPNIVLIVADDLGYGDLGCFGSQAIRTPVLDRLATDGVRMTAFYSSAPLCSPARAGLMTGRYPIRTLVPMPLYPAGAHMDVIFNAGGVYSYGMRGIPEDEVLLPELLQRRGYRTGMLGKWHLGDRTPHLPNERGFELFYGAYYSNDMQPYAIYRNDRVEVEAPGDQNTLTQNLTREALQFIQANADEPFFLYYSQPFPHVPLHASDAFRGRSAGGLYGDVVEEVDWSIGQIVDLLDALELTEDTVIIFTSDNGPWWQGSPGGTRGRKNLPFDGGYRVPFIARWPGVIPPGTTSDAVSMNFDLFPSLLSLAGIPLPADRTVDGRDILPVLRSQAPSPHETLYFYKGKRLVGVRHGDWKYLRRHMTDNGGYASLRQGPFLFNLAVDPDESYSLIESEPEVAARLARMLDDWDAAIDRNLRGWL
jgi:uncharacterized sulfatase